MAPVLTSVSPLSGPPGAAITCLGSGFTAASQVSCPTLVPTTYVDAGTLTAELPHGIEGPGGGSTQIGVYVMNADGSTSNVVIFTVLFPQTKLQAWTSAERVCSEVPGFKRGGQITDTQINTWIRSVAQEVAAALLRRGLSLDPATWQQPGSAAQPDPVDVLEMINRMGAGARLASAIGAQFAQGGQEWGVSKNLAAAYQRQLLSLNNGDYDKLFQPGAATVETGPQLAAETGACPAFTMERKF
jgi:IPT/TIG domain